MTLQLKLEFTPLHLSHGRLEIVDFGKLNWRAEISVENNLVSAFN